ncbi:MAG TPA: hypothetical protein VKZ63_09045 [Kofleriaceae bacterium]|nr:hypothetical protein [Kofleriaceae bacterium]
MTERPFFRTDLVSRPIDDGGQRFVEVTDPDSGNSFRFYEIEYAIACAMDGERDVSGLVEWAKIELGLEPSPQELETVIGTLEELGYLGGEPARPAAAPRAVAPPTPSRPAAARAGNGSDIQLGAPGKSPFDRPAAARLEAEDVELGFAGRSPSQPARPERPASGADIKLGAAGNIGLPDVDAVEPDIHDRVTRQRPALSREEIERGQISPEFSPEMSIDLSDHIPVRAADVKEAVRASKVMSAVRPEDLPPDVRAEATAEATPDKKPEPAPEAKAKEEPALARTIMGMPAPPAVAAAAGAASTDQPKSHVTVAKPKRNTPPPIPAAAAPTPLPEKPAPISEKLAAPAPAQGPARAAVAAAAAEEPAPEPRRSSAVPFLLVILFLAAAGAAAYWWIVLREKDQNPGGEEVGTAPAPPVDPAPAPEQPAPITAALEAGPSEERSILAPRAGRIAWLPEAGAEVAEGAAVARFDGYQVWERELEASKASQQRYQEKLDKATSKGDKSAMRRHEADVKRKQGDIDKATEELARFSVTSPIGGVVEPVVKLKDAVEKDAPLVTVIAQSDPQATFAVPAERSFAKGDEVKVVSATDAGLGVTCVVHEAAAGTVTVRCPTDSGLAPGTQVILE